MKKKIYCYSGVLLAGMLFLVGCGNEIPEMNEEERRMLLRSFVIVGMSPMINSRFCSGSEQKEVLRELPEDLSCDI